MTASNRLLGSAVASCLILFVAFAGIQFFPRHPPARTGATGSDDSFKGKPVCGQPVLKSPFSYDGPAGTYASGTPGLPTYGTAKSDFPHATAGVVIPTGTHNYLSYKLKPDTVYYLLPGTHPVAFRLTKVTPLLAASPTASPPF